jgi:cathepsin L
MANIHFHTISWAFSTIQSLEAANAIATGKLLDLSEQQLVDCSGSTGNEGCNGGLMDNAFDYLISAGGACLTSDYEYTARDGTCKKCTPAVKVKGYTQAGSGNAALSQTLQQGPIAVALSATSKFQFYSYVLVSS